MIKSFNRQEYVNTLNLIEDNNLNTVCLAANCPNRYECFSKKTATFLILGNKCTRNCKYCNIEQGITKIDPNEPKKIANAILKLGIKYAVITCVTRDDLEDGGANHFVKVINEIKKINCKVEVLISDLKGNWDALNEIVKAKPDVINHNIEVVKELFTALRPEGNYKISLQLLDKIKTYKTKSGIMVGLGETMPEIIKTLKDLKQVGVNFLTIGQYLQPTDKHAQVIKHYSDEEFRKLKELALEIGFDHVESGKLVRSSYNAEMAFN